MKSFCRNLIAVLCACMIALHALPVMTIGYAEENMSLTFDDGIVEKEMTLDYGAYFIEKVKKGHPDSYPDITFEDAFNKYYSNTEWNRNPKWSFLPDTTGDDFVVFEGECVYQGINRKIELHFRMNDDNTFTLFTAETRSGRDIQVFSLNESQELASFVYDPFINYYSTGDTENLSENSASDTPESSGELTGEPGLAPDIDRLQSDLRVGSMIKFGHYEQDNNLTNGAELIEWIVLCEEEGKYFLISRYGLGARPYNDEKKDVTWEDCTLRNWLNDEFLNTAFTKEEQSAILTTEVDNSRKAGYWGTDGGKNTEDKVFLLSCSEAGQYLGVTENTINTHSRVAPTAYALAQGAYVRDSYKTEDGQAAAWWWLRSPAINRSIAADVSYDGTFKYCDVDNGVFYWDKAVVRPALWLKLSGNIKIEVQAEQSSSTQTRSSAQTNSNALVNSKTQTNSETQKPHEIYSGVFRGCPFEIVTLQGFSFPQLLPYKFHPMEESEYNWGDYYLSEYIEGYDQFTKVIAYGDITQDEDAVRDYTSLGKNEELLSEEIIEIDGHLACLSIVRYTRPDKLVFLKPRIRYYRNNYGFEITFYSRIVNKKDWDSISQMTIKELEEFAWYISYDESTAKYTPESGAFSIKTENNQTVLSAGKSLQLSIEYDNPDCIQEIEDDHTLIGFSYIDKSGKKKPDGIKWSVIDLDTGEESRDVTIDQNDVITANKKIDKELHLEIHGKSVRFTSKATFPLTVIPAVKAITTEPRELTFYEGTTDSAVVKATLEPDCVPLSGITWTAANAQIVNIESGENGGTAVITPLKAGKTTITVKEPGGKNTKLTVNVVAPVESVELKANGAATAGGKVKIAATLAPKNVGNKAVQWSVDVGEDIATINEKGQLTISKTAPSGTKITVTCTALGAPSPVVGTLVVEVP